MLAVIGLRDFCLTRSAGHRYAAVGTRIVGIAVEHNGIAYGLFLSTIIVLCARHPAFTETVRHQRHLSFAACCGCSYNTCMCSVGKENEKHCKPKNGGADGRLRRGKQITPMVAKGNTCGMVRQT